MPSQWLNSSTGEQKGITQTTILTPSGPVRYQHISIKRQAEERTLPSFYAFGVTQSRIEARGVVELQTLYVTEEWQVPGRGYSLGINWGDLSEHLYLVKQ